MPDEIPRSRQARAAAEQALVRVVHHYGTRPEFVVLGGLVPELLCSGSAFQHAGTTDVDVQVNLEIACGSVNTSRLERALLNAEFQPDSDNIWRWRTDESDSRAVVKFELLADLDSAAAETTVRFQECERLGAANLRGTGYATRDVEVRTLTARIGGDRRTIEVNVAGLAGFLLAKCAAARSRRQPKDWYDMPSFCSTMTSEARKLPQGRYSNDSARTYQPFGRALMICWPTSPTGAPKAREPTRGRC